MQKTLMLTANRIRKQSHLSLVPLDRTTINRDTRLMMIWMRHWTCVDHQTTIQGLAHDLHPGCLVRLTDKEEELHARLDVTPKIKPTHDTQEKTGNNLGPNQGDITGDLLSAVPS
jgi:hypothetical protein